MKIYTEIQSPSYTLLVLFFFRLWLDKLAMNHFSFCLGYKTPAQVTGERNNGIQKCVASSAWSCHILLLTNLSVPVILKYAKNFLDATLLPMQLRFTDWKCTCLIRVSLTIFPMWQSQCHVTFPQLHCCLVYWSIGSPSSFQLTGLANACDLMLFPFLSINKAILMDRRTPCKFTCRPQTIPELEEVAAMHILKYIYIYI